MQRDFEITGFLLKNQADVLKQRKLNNIRVTFVSYVVTGR